MSSELQYVRVVFKSSDSIAIAAALPDMNPTYQATPDIARRIAEDFASDAKPGGVYDVIHHNRPCILALRFDRVLRID